MRLLLAFVLVCACGDNELPLCDDLPGCAGVNLNCTRDGRCSCDGQACVRAPRSIHHPDAGVPRD